MGVRGLTSFIARHAESYLSPYELHDCNLVIDGDNLACNLYKDVSGVYSAFGGDYDDYYRAVLEFFHVLGECNIQAFVLMDGGYEQKKLRTVNKRLRGKISVIKKINPCDSITVFPVLMKEVFVGAVKDCGIPIMRCLFEADEELAALSRKLRCPVLSYDSDFYIYNVQYIPLITLTVKAHSKIYKEDNNDNTKLRKAKAKHVEKRTKSNHVLESIHVNNTDKRHKKNGLKTYKYLDCCIYRIENLITRGSLTKEKLPLFAALLGNDYIARGCFKQFFLVGMGKLGRSRKLKQQQRRIRMVMQWLKHQTVESALEKILGRLQKSQREALLSQVEMATLGYSNEICNSYDFFLKNYGDLCSIKDCEPSCETSDLESNSDSLDCTGWDDSLSDTVSTEDCDSDGTESMEKSTNVTNSSDENEYISEGSVAEDQNNGIVARLKYTFNISVAPVGSSNQENLISEKRISNTDQYNRKEHIPKWFVEKFSNADFPRYFVDLIYLKKYINSPQIEHFHYNDCNEIALPILIYIFTLLNNAGCEENDKTVNTEFTYVTRATKATNLKFIQYPTDSSVKFQFNPKNPNPDFLKFVFKNLKGDLDIEMLFIDIKILPKDLQLYFLCIVYWMQSSQHYDLIHLHALLICLITLRTIDLKIPSERDLIKFKKRYGKIIKRERQIRDKESLDNLKRNVKEEVQKLDIPDRMPFIPKSDCYLVMNNLLKHFHMQEIFKKKYDEYSSVVLHAFAEFQSVIFQVYSLNALLEFPFVRPRIEELYCGVFLYNIYDLLRLRADAGYHVKNFIFKDSQMMCDFYDYLFEWCKKYIPQKKVRNTSSTKTGGKKGRKEKSTVNKHVSTFVHIDLVNESSGDDFYDSNNKFCTLLKK